MEPNTAGHDYAGGLGAGDPGKRLRGPNPHPPNAPVTEDIQNCHLQKQQFKDIT